MRGLAIGAGVLAGLAGLALAGVWLASSQRLTRAIAAPDTPVAAAAATPGTLARGRHRATSIMKCSDCHGDDFGGKVVIDDPALGVVSAPNLTRGAGGVGARLTAAVLERSVRHGLGEGDRPLVLMPSDDYQRLTDADQAALSAYLLSLPPVDRTVRPTALGPMGRALLVAGQLPVLSAERIAHERVGRATVAEGDTLALGTYLADIGGCTGCHRADLTGGPIPGTPPDWKPAANISASGPSHGWTEAQFVRAMRSGVRPDGTPIDTLMPWRLAGQMTDAELHAVWRFLQAPRG
ncbi:MAG: c-type cytochrome [Gemmatimonadales bacterium]|nr:c-type cytochrome [Gemmatimonadales bacterium]